jgi:oxygen-dependent protoporphyrinogen oxidase
MLALPLGRWIATFLVNQSQAKIRAKAILFTSPAHVTSQILSQSEGEGFDQAAKELNKIYYPPVASVTLAYPNEAFKVMLLSDVCIPRSSVPFFLSLH